MGSKTRLLHSLHTNRHESTSSYSSERLNCKVDLASMSWVASLDGKENSEFKTGEHIGETTPLYFPKRSLQFLSNNKETEEKIIVYILKGLDI